jgi:hypothetical protein
MVTDGYKLEATTAVPTKIDPKVKFSSVVSILHEAILLQVFFGHVCCHLLHSLVHFSAAMFALFRISTWAMARSAAEN